jgi:hypothetical protein
MAFSKTSVSVTTPQPVDVPVQRGDMREGKVWDGLKWITEAEWVAAQKKVNGGDS